MSHTTSFDGELEMFREAPRPPSLAHLRFLRWLAEQGRLEHAPAGVSSGALADPRTELEAMLGTLYD